MPGRLLTAHVRRPVAASQTADAGPVSIQLVWVGSLQAPRPRLIAGWVMVFTPEAPTYFLIGFSPESQIPQTDAGEVRTLRDYYDTDARLGLSGAFTWQALVDLTPGLPLPRSFNGLDSSEISRTIDRLGEVTVHGQRYDGQATLTLFESQAEAEALARLPAQSEVVRAIWTAAGAQHWSLETWLTELSLRQLGDPDDETIASSARRRRSQRHRSRTGTHP